MVKGQRSRKVNPRPSQWSRVESLNLILRVGLVIHNSKSNWEVKIGFLDTAACSGHNFCYTTRIDAIQLGLERRLKNLQFICFTLFNWRSLRGSKSGRNIRVVICQLQFSNQDQEFYLYLFYLDEFISYLGFVVSFYIPHCLKRDLCFCSYLYKAMFWLKINDIHSIKKPQAFPIIFKVFLIDFLN